MKKNIAVALMTALCLCLAACSGGSKPAAKNVDLKAVYDSFGIADEEMLALTEDDLMEYYGIESGDVKQFAGAVTLSAISSEEIVLIEAKDSSAAKTIKGHLDDRYASKAAQMKDYIPEQYAIIEKCSVTQSGNFVAMIISANAESYVKTYEAAIK